MKELIKKIIKFLFKRVSLGAVLPQATGVFETSLQTGITSSDTSMNLKANAIRGGGEVSGYTCFTIDEGSAQAEVACGTVLGTAVSSMTRGISYADGVTSVAANKFSHRRGANIKITDYPIIQILKAQNNGDATFPNPISYETGIAPLSGSDLTDKEYVDSVVNGGTLSYDQIVISGTGGEVIDSGELIYLNVSDGEWYLTDADTVATIENVILAIAQGAGIDGGIISGGVLISGLDDKQTGLASGTIYYASDTPGAISSSVGTNTVAIGIGSSATKILFIPRFSQQLTAKQIAALGGSQGVIGTGNLFLTEDNGTSNETDQTQTTTNATTGLGEADATTKKNSIAQSFIPEKTKIRGVNFWKIADTGSFTGTVTVSLQADTSGSPSGTPLATATLTNSQWNLLDDAALFEVLFSAEYASLVVGDLYWIEISTSTSSNTVHPNIGSNTAGGYANGSVKYNNATDGWVDIATIDLWFKTLEGVNSQFVETNANGKIDLGLIDQTAFDTPMFPQITYGQRGEGETTNNITSNKDGTIIITSGGGNELKRFEKNAKGIFMFTHAVSTSGNGEGIVIIGDYVYHSYNATDIQRRDLADLTNVQTMTGENIGDAGFMWNAGNGKIGIQTGSTTSEISTISGTVFTQESTPAFSSSINGAEVRHIYNGFDQKVYVTVSPTLVRVYDNPEDLSGGGTSITLKGQGPLVVYGNSDIAIIPSDKSSSYLILNELFYSSASESYLSMRFIPIVKPE